jgi:hypothetical protein
VCVCACAFNTLTKKAIVASLKDTKSHLWCHCCMVRAIVVLHKEVRRYWGGEGREWGGARKQTKNRKKCDKRKKLFFLFIYMCVCVR